MLVGARNLLSCTYRNVDRSSRQGSVDGHGGVVAGLARSPQNGKKKNKKQKSKIDFRRMSTLRAWWVTNLY
jgi:hypothetical protein